jgi:hypothetical protein
LLLASINCIFVGAPFRACLFNGHGNPANNLQVIDRCLEPGVSPSAASTAVPTPPASAPVSSQVSPADARSSPSPTTQQIIKTTAFSPTVPSSASTSDAPPEAAAPTTDPDDSLMPPVVGPSPMEIAMSSMGKSVVETCTQCIYLLCQCRGTHTSLLRFKHLSSLTDLIFMQDL